MTGEVDGRATLISTVGGGLSGGVGGLLSGSRLAVQVGAGALTDGGISAGSQYLLTGTVSPGMVALDSTIGTAAGAGGWLNSRGQAGTIASGVDGASGAAVRGSFPESHGVTFFDEKIAEIIKNSDVSTLGRPNELSWLMPVEDAANITSPAAAARYTGAAPSVERAVVNGERVFGLSVPMDGQTARIPTPADAMLGPNEINPHFLEGGRTAVRTGDGPTAGYLLNPNREFVVPGGGPMPSGSVLFEVLDDGSWAPLKRF